MSAQPYRVVAPVTGLALLAIAARAAAPGPIIGGDAPPDLANLPSDWLPAHTPAPDGIGELAGPAPSAGELRESIWVDESTIQPLKAGDRMPSGAVVSDMEGRPFDLNAAVARQPTILIFYRGGWCPLCNAHLRELQASMPELQRLGYQVLGISRDKPATLKSYSQQNQLVYPLYSDGAYSVAEKFGLVFKVKADYLEHMRRDHKVDIAVTADDAGDELLTPGAYILDREGRIRFAYVNKNFMVRISQQALLAAAREAIAGK